MKKIAVLVTIVVLNVLTYFLVLPFAQKTANSHMGNGPLLGIIYCILAFCTILLSIRSLKQKDVLLFFLFVLLTAALIYWGTRLHSLYCLECTSSG
ncbi:MAG: hypothetical protein M3R17_16405 [Bacteroidota bacterium]|nr:hypothetical protein [Bacteroidota bacterium]